MNQYFTVKKSNIFLKKKFVQGVSPGKKIPAQAVREKKNSYKLKIPHHPPPPITFLMVRPLDLENRCNFDMFNLVSRVSCRCDDNGDPGNEVMIGLGSGSGWVRVGWHVLPPRVHNSEYHYVSVVENPPLYKFRILILAMRLTNLEDPGTQLVRGVQFRLCRVYPTILIHPIRNCE